MKQHSSPVIIKKNESIILKKVSLNTKSYTEEWVQNLCFNNPNLLPVEEIEPTFGGMIPICTELSIKSGFIDLVYINEYGFITIGECKLWRNPEARRKVIGQILDYAKDLSKLNYSKFEKICLAARKDKSKSLFSIINEQYPEIDESSFVDNVQNNLKKGRFLLAIIGDGIRGNMEEIAEYIHRNGNLNFTLGLIELPVYENPNNNELVITPRILVKTKEIERIIYRIAENDTEEESISHKTTSSKSISENVFYERLNLAIGKKKSEEFNEFIQTLNDKFNIIPTFGRGKKISLNLKSSDEFYNFASVQDDGEVWFYGVMTRALEVGNRQIGIDYLKQLAVLVKGQYHDDYSNFQWCVKRNRKYINIIEYLSVKKEWQELISNTLAKINALQGGI